MAKAITFFVSGQEVGAAVRGAADTAIRRATLPAGRIVRSVQMGAPRAAGGEARLEAQDGRDVLALHIAGGPTLFLSPSNAAALMASQAGATNRDGQEERFVSAAGDEVRLPARLQWRGLQKSPATRGGLRGGFGEVLVEHVDLLSGFAEDLTARAVVEHFDQKVNEGVYRLDREHAPVLKGDGAPGAVQVPDANGEPVLVLVHGTFSSTAGTFSDLWRGHRDLVARVFDQYKDRVFALDHRTLAVSPLANALTLARSLPSNARVHLLTHSRGGLVAEAFARACANHRNVESDVRFFSAPGYEAHAGDLRALYAEVARKNLAVEREVRVACPSRGTLLASKRLDAYFSIFKWSLELAGWHVPAEIVDFIAAVAKHRTKPEEIPGLEAQIPMSPFVQWLHGEIEPIAGQLRVVAGDLEGDSVFSWVKTLLADSFYWTDNDLIVQTRSMYGGVPREDVSTFLLDRGGKVSHFAYFANDSSAGGIADALTAVAPPRFQPIGPESYAGTSSAGSRARALREPAASAQLPALFLLPGILGSNLDVEGRRVWLGPRMVFGLEKLEYRPGATNVVPESPLELYDGLRDFLEETHEVTAFAFDWRKPLEEEARRLADAVDKAIAAREATGQPVRIVAHSMGGLLARTLLLERPDVWKRMMARPGARVLMLGTPNAGSWAPMEVLSGDDRFGNMLLFLGAPFRDRQARAMMAAFPGFIQLQAGLRDSGLGLDSAATWQKLADDDLEAVRDYNAWHAWDGTGGASHLDEFTWGVPSQQVLDQAVALRTRLDQQRDQELRKYSDKILLVVGKADFTPDGFNAHTPEGLVYLGAADGGDGRVTLASARLPGVRTWQVDCDHGKLPQQKAAFGGFLELLQTGSTGALAPVPEPGTRGAASTPPATALATARPSRGRSWGDPPTRDRDLFASPTDRALERMPAEEPGKAIRITVINGDLKFVSQPLMIGHYRSMRLTGTERTMDELIGGTMSQKLRTMAYPVQPGENAVFGNLRPSIEYPGQLPRPEAVVVAGLGEEGKLRSVDLLRTVRQAVIEWSQCELEKPAGARVAFEMAATLIASGGTGVSAGQSAQLVVEGALEANQYLAKIGWPVLERLSLIELYLERATEAWRALREKAATSSRFAVDDRILERQGAMRRPLDTGYRGAEYDFVSALTDADEGGGEMIRYTLDTRRARTEIRAQAMQGPLLRQLVEAGSNDRNDDAQIGRTLFSLLVPIEMESFMGGSSEVVLELDAGTAGIPWELIDTDVPGSNDKRPWAIRSKMIRKLSLENFRAAPDDATTEERVLVIGEPLCDEKLYGRLPGARAEAAAVRDAFAAPGVLGPEGVVALIASDEPDGTRPDNRAIVNALMGSKWRIVHISGHGEPPARIGPEPKTCDDPPQKEGDPRGVVLSDCTYLGPREVQNMRVVPELVFVNCCYLAARDPQQALRKGGYNRSRFASTVAEQLIRIGVRCVVAAGWAVADDAAARFAGTFYDAIVRNRRFIDAVAEAREAAHALGGNTWAAYQCYGDPDWVFRREAGAPRGASPRPLSEQYAGIASSAALENALQTLATQSRFQAGTGDRDAMKNAVRYLEDRFGADAKKRGSTAAEFGNAWDAVGDRAKAIEWYEYATRAEDATAPVKATEQLVNLRVRAAWSDVYAALLRGERDDARFDAARGRIEEGIALLDKLASLNPTAERWSLVGSAHKRLAMLDRAQGRSATKAIGRARDSYAKAEKAARDAGLTDVYYPAMNVLAMEVASRKGAVATLDEARVAAVEKMLREKMRDDADFWAAAGIIELRLLQALAERDDRREERLASVREQFKDLYLRVKAKAMWGSILDQAVFLLGPPAGDAAHASPAASELLKVLQGYA